ncbi:MAG: RES family NAD+ phosphorylase [Thalassovita sp.]|nr:RES family NAD+ phosphorylase [Thalassovita sp.]
MIPFTGTVWRLVFADQSPTAPVRSPEGRFHHAGQAAIYTSLTAEGAAIAIRRYLHPDDPPRLLYPLEVDAERVADMRGDPAVSVVWQDIRAAGKPAPTWTISDRVRAQGAQGLLYSSRSRPDLAHLVLFAELDKVIRRLGPARPWGHAEP